jgi:AAA+ ATPase superfamily predicted ATPase
MKKTNENGLILSNINIYLPSLLSSLYDSSIQHIEKNEEVMKDLSDEAKLKDFFTVNLTLPRQIGLTTGAIEFAKRLSKDGIKTLFLFSTKSKLFDKASLFNHSDVFYDYFLSHSWPFVIAKNDIDVIIFDDSRFIETPARKAQIKKILSSTDVLPLLMYL